MEIASLLSQGPAAPFYRPAPRSSSETDARVFALLRWACVALFLGRAWQHLRWDAPYRALLWSQDTMEPVVNALLGLSWETYATSPAVAAAIATGIKLVGLFHLACAFAAWRCGMARESLSAPSRWPCALLIAGSLALTFLAYCSYRDRVYRVGEFVEHAAQFGLPLLLALAARGVLSAPRLLLSLRVAVACTFAGHGLYAVGFYPTPGEWVTMTMAATGLSEPGAFAFLRVAGWLDFAVAAAVFIPVLRIARAAFAYAAAWGLLTALARPAAFVRWENFSDSSAQWLHEAVVRLPHAALPLAALWLLRREATAAAAARRAAQPMLTLHPFALPSTQPGSSSNPAHRPTTT